MNVGTSRRGFLLARQHRSLLLHLNSHLHPHVLHIWHVVAVTGIVRVVVLFAELADVVEIEEGGLAVRLAMNVEKELFGERVEVLQVVF